MIFESVISSPTASTSCIVLKGPTGCGKSFLFDQLIQKFEKFIRISDIDSLHTSSLNEEANSFYPDSSCKCENSLFPALSFSSGLIASPNSQKIDHRKVVLRLTDAHFFQSIGLGNEYSHIRKSIELLKTHSGILLIEVTDFEFEGSMLQGYILKVLKETFPKNYHYISLNSSTSTILKKTLEPVIGFINSFNIPIADFIEEFNGDSRALLHDLYTISLNPKLKRMESLRDYRTDFFHYVGKLLYVSKTGLKIFDDVSFWDIDYNLYLTFLQYYFPKFCPDLRLLSLLFDQFCAYDIIPWKVLKHVSIESHMNACKYSPLYTCFHSINDPKTLKSAQKFFSFARPPLIEDSSEIRKKCRKAGICPEDLYIRNINKM